MNISLSKLGACVALLGGAVWANAQDVPWQVDGGTAAVQFFPDNLQAYGIELTNITPTAFGNFPMEGAIGFKVEASSSLQIMTENQHFGYHLGGVVNIKGGFTLKSGKRSVSLYNIAARAQGTPSESPISLTDGLGGTFAPSLTMDHPLTSFDAVRASLVMGWADLKLSKDAAVALGHPEAEGLLIGGFSIWSSAHPTVPIPPPLGGGNGLDNTNADVALFNMSSLASIGRDGVAYPNGTSGFATLTTSCNKGATNIDWFAPMNESHPVIVQQMYRVRLGRIEQIGAAYLKHGFFATNTPNSTCGVGINPGTGSLLGPGLTDTYGTGNNSDRYYLGPRSEVNPFTGHWTAFGSFFDVGTAGSTPDGQRSLTSTQANALPPHKNRIEVKDADLIIPSGESRQYLYEAFYLCEQETNLANQIGSRQANITWTGTTWGTSDAGAFNANTASIEQYVTMTNATKNLGAGDVNAMVNKVNNLAEGWIYVSCNPIRLGGGLWQYELAVYNYTSDRQIRELRLPMLSGMTVTNIGFRDTDANAANDWTGSYNSSTGEIAWSTETFAQNPNANSLKYGSLYNFTFTANVAPSTTAVATLGLFKTGAVMTNTANTVAPPNGAVAATTYSVVMGVNGGGGVAQIATSDNQYAIINEDIASDNLHTASAIVTGTSPIANPGSLKIEVESNGDIDGRFQIIELWNYTTNAWDVVTSDVINIADSSHSATITGVNAAKYVNSTTKEVKARLNMDLGAAETINLAKYRIDLVKWTIGV